MVERIRPRAALLPKPPLLITESTEQFDALYDAVEQEIKPSGIIERMYMMDYISIIWEILRVRRCKAAIVNTAFRAALTNLLYDKLGVGHRVNEELEDRDEWFTDREAKKWVLEVLRHFHLDESAIEAEAIELSMPSLEWLDKMLVSLESRRDKVLHRVAEYRCGLAQQLRTSTDRIIEEKAVPQLQLASNKESGSERGERKANSR